MRGRLLTGRFGTIGGAGDVGRAETVGSSRVSTRPDRTSAVGLPAEK